MQIRKFKISQVNLSKSIKQKIKNKISQNRGATIQKLTQLFDETENRTLIDDINLTDQLLDKLSYNTPLLYSQIESISENFYQGSIGNIHCAYLKCGDKVAIKSLRPGIKEKILSDLKNSDNLIGMAGKFVDTEKFESLNSFSSRFINSLVQECDFDNEISNYRKLSPQFENFNKLKLPKLYKEFSNSNYLVLEWIDSTKNLEEIGELDISDRKEIQKELSEFFYYSPIIYGVTQEDSNLSNFLIKGSELYFIDLGKVEFIPLNFRIAFVKLLEVLEKKEQVSILDLYVKMGFDKKLLLPLENMLSDISEILMIPLLNANVTDFSQWNPTAQIDTIAHNLKWNLRSSAPMHYFSLTRSFFGYVKLSKLLDAPINQSYIKEHLLFHFKQDLERYVTKKDQIEKYNFVNIKVTRGHEEKVNLHLPYSSVYELESLINEDIKNKLRARKLDIKELVETALKEKRSEVFTLNEGSNIFQVFLTKS
jgi:predicted unusual protein kinase regulating ubiquinone biosynthesis (AarF/ABC1/UbiB family)